jgi:hypothetical protein
MKTSLVRKRTVEADRPAIQPAGLAASSAGLMPRRQGVTSDRK